jgi:diaminopimelate decarboxylase
LEPEVIHFHLRTNVASPDEYAEAMDEVLGLAQSAGWSPAVLDIGGGFPVEHVRDAGDTLCAARFSLEKMRGVVTSALQSHPHIRELWMENGRWLTAPAAVLAVRVLDIKERRGARILICDGGRTLHAMVAAWERHRVVSLPARRGAMVPTLVCGPTCMAFDHLGCHPLPTSVRPGDVLLWMDAGAYQLAWETRFSHGLAPITWTSGDCIRRVRAPETFRSWWAAK